MLELVVGGLVERNAEYVYTFCPTERYTGIGTPLEPEASMLILALTSRYNQPINITHTRQLKECTSPICLLFQYADFEELRVEKGEATYVAPVVDPASLIVAIALAYALERRLGGGWLVEVYSDAWLHHVDILLYLKALRGVVRIYTTTLSERAMAADHVVVNHSFKQEALGLKEYRGYPWCSPPAAPPPGVEEEVEELVKTAVESGGFISLKYALEQYGQRAVARAIALGLLRYDPVTMSLKVTEAALGRG